MKATCPNNPDHKSFVTVAHVTQDWIADEFIRELETLETTHGGMLELVMNAEQRQK